MALPAFLLPVRTKQLIAGKVMVECFFIKTDYFEIPSMVVAMTGDTLPPPNLCG